MFSLDNIKTFIKYGFSGIISFVFDYLLFSILSFLIGKSIGDSAIIVATVIARVCSSTLNYLLNKNKVFNFKGNKKEQRNTVIKYFTLVVIQMFVSAFSVYYLKHLFNIDEKIIKLPVEAIIFVVNYFVQKKIIFRKR